MNNTLLNDNLVKEELKEEIKDFLEFNENEDTSSLMGHNESITCYYTRSHARPGRTPQTRIFCCKTLLLTSSGARVQEARERKRNPVPFLGELYFA